MYALRGQGAQVTPSILAILLFLALVFTEEEE